MVEFINVKGNRAYFREEGVNTKISRVWKEVNGMKIFTIKDETYQVADDNSSISLVTDGSILNVPVTKTQAPSPLQSEFDINQRFGFLEKFTNMTLSNITSSLLICGQSGLGKSHTVLEILEKNNLVEDEDYIIIKGYATPKALYATLYENKDKVVIFDDCDSVLKDPTSLNILKGALDSYAVRKISWLSKGFIDDGLPSSFNFEGQVIFISNISLDRIDGAVKGRTLSVDVTMSVQDRIDRMTAIADKILPEFSMDIKLDVLEFIDENKYEATELNMRTFEQIIKIASAYNGSSEWRDANKYVLTNA